MKQACIYLVANKSSQIEFCNLVHSIRSSGCTLDIVLIPFGGAPIDDKETLGQVVTMSINQFPEKGIAFINKLGDVLINCPNGYLRRYLSFFGPYDRFIYSDNDIVALCNWEKFIDKLDYYDLVNADEEYTTKSRYNIKNIMLLETEFGPLCHEHAVTAGHFAARKSSIHLESMTRALEWIRKHSDSCYLHDQTLLQIALLLGNLKAFNFCKAPDSWLSSWAGDYRNTLELIQCIQSGSSISHLHYSGGPVEIFDNPIHELLLSKYSRKFRFCKHMISGVKTFTGLNLANQKFNRIMKILKLKLSIY